VAVVAFVVGLVTSVIAVGGLLILAALVLALDALVLGTVRWSERRGRPLVLVSMVLVNAASTRDRLSDRAAHVLAALRGGDASAVDRSLEEGARKAGLAERIRRRYEEVVKAAGAYRGPIETGGLWTGAVGAFEPPAHGAEILGPAEAALPEPPEGTAWVLAGFERGSLHVALVPRGAGDESFKGKVDALLNAVGPGASEGIWVDVRFFRTP
jgi:hypothetical protein